MNHFAGRMLLVSLLLSAAPAWALGVGEPHLSSALNMPLVAALPLTDTGTLTADDIHAGLASADRFNEAAFSVGDQLLWGAAEPLKRMLMVLREHKGL